MKNFKKNELQENELILKAKNGDIYSRNKLIENSIPLIKKIAQKTIQTTTLSENDLINEGIFALVVALEKFNPDYGYKFSTYATWWIKQAMFKAISEQSYAYNIPVYIQETLSPCHQSSWRTPKKKSESASPLRESGSRRKIGAVGYASSTKVWLISPDQKR